MNGVRHFLLALQFFTRVPVTGGLAGWVGYSPAMLRASAAHFPGVGWLVGAVGAGVFVIAQLGLPGWAGALVAALLSTIATVWMTGAFHEDGLADLADGLGGSADRERALAIMKDSRIGAFGAIALVLALALKVALLAVLAGQGALAVAAALVAAHVLSRLAPLFLIRWLPYVGGEGGEGGASKAKPLADAIGGSALLAGIAWSLPALGLLVATHDTAHGLAALALCAVAALGVGRLLRRRLQGFTGDGLGATQQVAEIAIYLALAWQA
ncbi:adenosylcobinamide-GDP ribazoletransferase [Variovorax sp. J22P168]|uniref:adenosylcobinamide-GDP ribazoletransferase n=1 Tax=Variovorax jilinensis TaxID=3053513 RepID=UPI002577E60F|nr:adenosylcobinamide-GDP ribazoletransferase [Variovorax sp. J22P168]MDM0013107.1 adenosylcobinamide-GDP ribazoletransferase [Variovorax sp. J22P168]